MQLPPDHREIQCSGNKEIYDENASFQWHFFIFKENLPFKILDRVSSGAHVSCSSFCQQQDTNKEKELSWLIIVRTDIYGL